MNRRAFVGSLAAILPLTAGCAGDTEPMPGASATDPSPSGRSPESTDPGTVSSTPASTDIDVAVTYRHGSGMTGQGETLEIYPDSRLTYTYDCGQLLTDTGDGGPREGALTRSEADRLERLVKTADPASWAEHYDCGDPCPTDMPGTSVTLTVDDTTYRTGFPAMAEIPDPLDDLVEFLRERADTFRAPCR